MGLWYLWGYGCRMGNGALIADKMGGPRRRGSVLESSAVRQPGRLGWTMANYKYLVYPVTLLQFERSSNVRQPASRFIVNLTALEMIRPAR